ncbi:hypothetical protein [Natronococcus roseus]|uniref:hypothetical protein n=1 Tax=Natronococcus roseus TaxID=1052014 RepID=UPI00374DE820
MTKNKTDSPGGADEDTAEELIKQPYPELMNVARSARENHEADISTDAPKKPELVEQMTEAGIRLDEGAWMIETEDGAEEIDRLESNPSPDRDGPSEPQPEVVLYAQTRAGATEDRIEEIEDALGEIGYELRENDRSDSLSIIVPPELDEDQIDPEEVTRDEVYGMAKDLDIDGRSDMSKEELVEAVESAR